MLVLGHVKISKSCGACGLVLAHHRVKRSKELLGELEIARNRTTKRNCNKKNCTIVQPSCIRFSLMMSMSAVLWKCFCTKTVIYLMIVMMRMSNDLHVLNSENCDRFDDSDDEEDVK